VQASRNLDIAKDIALTQGMRALAAGHIGTTRQYAATFKQRPGKHIVPINVPSHDVEKSVKTR